MRLYGLIASMLIMLSASDATDEASKKDLANFQGTWNLISSERDGKKTPQEEAKKVTLAIQGDQFVLRKDSVTISEGRLTLDPIKTPKEIDESITTGPNKGKVFLAIYEMMKSITKSASLPLERNGQPLFPRLLAVAIFFRSGSEKRNECPVPLSDRQRNRLRLSRFSFREGRCSVSACGLFALLLLLPRRKL